MSVLETIDYEIFTGDLPVTVCSCSGRKWSADDEVIRIELHSDYAILWVA